MKAYQDLLSELGNEITLVAISKTKPTEKIIEVYEQGHKDFGENKVQELSWKSEKLPTDIRWHFVGHLQRNKVKYLASFVHLIHSVDSIRLAREIDKQAEKNNRKIGILIQAHIADEESKFGVPLSKLADFFQELDNQGFRNIEVQGLMGMATNTKDAEKVREEFLALKKEFVKLSRIDFESSIHMKTLSMGMSGDYKIAIEAGSNMIRIGTMVFGPREL